MSIPWARNGVGALPYRRLRGGGSCSRDRETAGPVVLPVGVRPKASNFRPFKALPADHKRWLDPPAHGAEAVH